MKTVYFLLVIFLIVSRCTATTTERVQLKEDFQVLQRDSDDMASCEVHIVDATAGSKFQFRCIDQNGHSILEGTIDARQNDSGGRMLGIENIPTGGPYKIEIMPADATGMNQTFTFEKIFVGDIWLTGGQSNMFGHGLPDEPQPAIEGVSIFDNQMVNLDAHWIAAEPPVHRVAMDKERTEFKRHSGRIGPAESFARSLYKESGVPVGIIPAAMGGALAIWDPDQREKNRFGFLERQIKNAGGRIRGMIWMQGEQDAIFGNPETTVTTPSLIYPTSTYGAEFKKLVEALRAEFGGPNMPVIIAQISRHHHPPYYALTGYDNQHVQEKQLNPEMLGGVGWERIREAQRQIAEDIPDVLLSATIDLPENDGLHLDYAAQKRNGERMAYLALPYIKKGVPPRKGISFKSARLDPATHAIHVEFDHVSGRLRAGDGDPEGFQLRSPAKKTGEGESWIYKTEFNPRHPSRVVLHLSGGAPADGLLYYAPGAAPFANITDDNDMAVPAFGPIRVSTE